eukprot:m.245571 g.245571  ORF g.245571 m.245571 type:complete len:327 (-) comp16108_c2_seq1:23-1003(-)
MSCPKQKQQGNSPLRIDAQNCGKRKRTQSDRVCWFCIYKEVSHDNGIEKLLRSQHNSDSLPSRFYLRGNHSDCQNLVNVKEKEKVRARFTKEKQRCLERIAAERDGSGHQQENPSQHGTQNDADISLWSPSVSSSNNGSMSMETGIPDTETDIENLEKFESATTSLSIQDREILVEGIEDDKARKSLVFVLKKAPNCSKRSKNLLDKVLEDVKMDIEVIKLGNNDFLAKKIQRDYSLILKLMSLSVEGQHFLTPGSINYNYMCVLRLPKDMYSRTDIVVIADKLKAESKTGFRAIKPEGNFANVNIDSFNFGTYAVPMSDMLNYFP